MVNGRATWSWVSSMKASSNDAAHGVSSYMQQTFTRGQVADLLGRQPFDGQGAAVLRRRLWRRQPWSAGSELGPIWGYQLSRRRRCFYATKSVTLAQRSKGPDRSPRDDPRSATSS